MRILKIRRIKKFASCLMPYWIIGGSVQTIKGNYIPEKHSPDDLGIRIMNGQSLEIELDDDVNTFFVMNADGLTSEEITLNPERTEYSFCITTKGGFRVPSYPAVIKSE
ncbi:MAG: hypothetical protein NC340_05685 [Ruminococcus flavefaciens]|nr:hypothetical protein [Ruminococcus flavefaciens]MCM1230536.1 hypothetical protein [Ruminococcus flavefaciens]